MTDQTREELAKEIYNEINHHYIVIDRDSADIIADFILAREEAIRKEERAEAKKNLYTEYDMEQARRETARGIRGFMDGVFVGIELNREVTPKDFILWRELTKELGKILEENKGDVFLDQNYSGNGDDNVPAGYEDVANGRA